MSLNYFLLNKSLLFFLLLLWVKWVLHLLFLSLYLTYSGSLSTLSLDTSSRFSILSMHSLISSKSCCSFSSVKGSGSLDCFLSGVVNGVEWVTLSRYLTSCYGKCPFTFSSVRINLFLPRFFFKTSIILGSYCLIALNVSFYTFYLFSKARSSSLIWSIQYSNNLPRVCFSYSI